MHFHTHTKAPASWLPRTSSLLLILTLVLVSSQGIESIVKQQQQQQQQQTQPQSQQQRSDDISLQQQNGSSNNNNMFNNHHQPSSASVSSSASQQQSPGQSQSQAVPQQSAGSGGRPPMDVMSGYAPANQKASSITYSDSMAAAASNPEQSYQAAAQSVNMALANSGIFGPSSQNSYQPQPQSQSQPQAQQQQQQLQQQQQNSASNGNPSSLNPLHYFYYPAKDSSNAATGSSSSSSVPSGASATSSNKQSISGGGDMIANAASNSYQSMSAYPSYTDQYNSGLFGGSSALGGVATPDAAASSQDPSYLPQPSPIDQYSNINSNNNNNMPGQSGQQFGSDLSGYASSPMQSSVPSSISFNGPSSSSSSSGMANGGNQQQQQPQQQSNGMMSLGQNDYLNSHMGGQQQQQQQQQASVQQQQPAPYQNSLFNQLASGGDLSTSNFGNNAGGLSSIAMYMPPNSQQQQQQQQQQSPHDLFSSGALGNQFNSAASQLAPAAIAPPQSQQSQQASSLFGNGASGSSLFGASSQQSGGQQQNYGSAGSIQGAHNYLSSFLTPQQYTQMTGQQLSSMASEQSPLSLSSLQQQHQQQAGLGGPSQSVNSLLGGPAISTPSSKRFGLSSFIMPMLALAGLSLLIPTMSNIQTALGRKKRSIVEERESASNRQQQIGHESMNGASQIHKENSIGEYLDKIERYYAIYKNAVENDDCLNRLICEFGDAVKDVTGRGAVVTVIEKLVPNWMSGKMHLFKEAALSGGPSGKEKCKKYVCHSNRQQQ